MHEKARINHVLVEILYWRRGGQMDEGEVEQVNELKATKRSPDGVEVCQR